ncbi:MAG: hypothetical protein AB1491_01265 [Thermodesulfobacteriota bacterium]
MSQVIIFVPVGISLLDNNSISSRGASVNALISRAQNLGNKIITRIRPDSRDKDPKNPAEVTSLYALRKKKSETLENKCISLVLLCDAGAGLVCAKVIKSLLEDHNYFDKPARSNWTVDSPVVLSNLDPQNPVNFLQAMHDLAGEIQKRIKDFDGEIYLNITGGYKAMAPYLTLMGMALGRHVQVFYQYEDSQEIIELPTYPLAFDLLEWRDWRGLLLPFTLNLGLAPEQKQQQYQALAESKLQGLIHPDTFSLNPVGRLLTQTYQQEKGVRLSEYGTGGLLLDRCPSYQSYLQDHCIPFWRHLSVGDHLPETVEHGRGHVQRLLELAQQLILAADLRLTDDQLFVLLGGIWLHDLGHTGDYFTFEGEQGLICDKDDHLSTRQFPVYGDPNLVREYHNFLTYELLKQHEKTLFPQVDSRPANDPLYRSIALACLYHRRKMPIKGEKAGKDCCWYVAKGLADFEENKEVIPGFAQVAALLRFLDGVENQKERAGSDQYYQVVRWVLGRKLNFLKEFNDEESREFKDASFKRKTLEGQYYEMHQSISQVFLVPQPGDGLDARGIYPNDIDSKKIVGIYMVKAAKSHLDSDQLIKEVINGVLEEFLLVQEFLPFRVAFFLLEEPDEEPEDDNKPRVKHQIIITPGDNKKPKDWPYELKEI